VLVGALREEEGKVVGTVLRGKVGGTGVSCLHCGREELEDSQEALEDPRLADVVVEALYAHDEDSEV